jgi:hypothetical protein
MTPITASTIWTMSSIQSNPLVSLSPTENGAPAVHVTSGSAVSGGSPDEGLTGTEPGRVSGSLGLSPSSGWGCGSMSGFASGSRSGAGGFSTGSFGVVVMGGTYPLRAIQGSRVPKPEGVVQTGHGRSGRNLVCADLPTRRKETVSVRSRSIESETRSKDQVNGVNTSLTGSPDERRVRAPRVPPSGDRSPTPRSPHRKGCHSK